MDQRLVVLKARLRRYERAMDDPHGDGSGRDSRPPNGDDYNDVFGEVIEVLEAIEASEAQDEHLPTLEGVIAYLEGRNDIEFLAYRNHVQVLAKPSTDVQMRLESLLYEQWIAVGDAKEIAAAADPAEEARKQKRSWYPKDPMPDGETIEEWTARKQETASEQQ
jgi:hypothetical protein